MIDRSGIGVRVRSHLSRLRPEHGEPLRRVAQRLGLGTGAAVVDPAADAWLGSEVRDLEGAVLEVGPHGRVTPSPRRQVSVLDPWGRAEATFVGPVGPVLGDERFDAVVAPWLGSDETTGGDPTGALRVLSGSLRPGGVLVAVVDAATAGSARGGAVGAGRVVHVERIAGSAAAGVRVEAS